MTEKKHWKSKLIKKPTQWLRDLPPGEYSVHEITTLTGKGSSAIMSRMNLLEIPRRYEYRDKYPRVIYIWKGIVAYEKNYTQKIKNNEKKNSNVV
jgi:hypothetical protein